MLQETTESARVLKPLEEIPFGEMVLVILAVLVLVKLTEWLLPRLAERLPGRLRHMLLPLVPVLRVAFLLLAVALIVPMVVERTSENLLALAGAGGLALGFAFKDYGSSIVAGFVNLYERPCRPGDWIRVDDAYGEVKSLGLRAIKIVTPDDTAVSIPNLKIWTENIHNDNDGQVTHLCVADFFLHPEHDGAWVRQKLLDVAYSSAYLQLERRVSVAAAEKPWGTHYRLKAYPVDGRSHFEFTTDLTLRGKEALLKRGIRLAVATVAAGAS